MNPIEKYAKLLESLKVKKDQGPAEMHGWRFDEPFTKFWVERLKKMAEMPSIPACGIEYLVERCRRAEENAKSETLLEDVKEVVADALHVGFKQGANAWMTYDDYETFRKLSEPED